MNDDKPAQAPIKVAYLVNLYPKISHTFIRREIQALEAQGVDVRRYAIRRVKEPLVDDKDREELTKTTILLDLNPASLLFKAIRVVLTDPVRFLQTLRLAVRSGIGSDRGLVRHLIYLGEACALLDILQRDPVDHVHAHFATNSTAVAMYCSALGGPGYSFTAHGLACFNSPQGNRLGLKLERAQFAVAVSEHGRRALIASSPGIEQEKVHVVRCGFDEGFAVEPASPGISGNQLTVIGRLSSEKGHRVLLEAAKRLAQEQIDFNVVLIGDGELRDEIEAQIASMGLGDRVEIAGWQDSVGVRKALEKTRALVVASYVEGLPVVIMEAMAMGRPIVSTNVGGISELVIDRETGWLVPPGDSERLAEAMKMALETSDEELTRMGTRARQRVLRMHDVRREAAKLRELFGRSARQRAEQRSSAEEVRAD
jgi:glycosyltransferase involved in cell wall biosynthesis